LSRRYVARGLPLSVTDAVTGRHVRGGSSPSEECQRTVPRAASAMSSIELVGITRGPGAGRDAWRLYQTLRRCTALVVKLTAKGPLSARSARKRHELRSTEAATTTLLELQTPHYPLVKTLARRSQP
jgi:hypothetical protein